MSRDNVTRAPIFRANLKPDYIINNKEIRGGGGEGRVLLTRYVTCVCRRSILDATVNAVVVGVVEDWFVQARTGTVAAACRWCRWRCGCCCCSTSFRVIATARWLPLLLSLSPFGEWSCPATQCNTHPQAANKYDCRLFAFLRGHDIPEIRKKINKSCNVNPKR